MYSTSNNQIIGYLNLHSPVPARIGFCVILKKNNIGVFMYGKMKSKPKKNTKKKKKSKLKY